MLVLDRKIEQSIIISGDIEIRILNIQRNRVKIGIKAPKEMVILRKELLERGNDN